MRIKKILSAAGLALGLMLALPALSGPANPSTVLAEEAIPQTQWGQDPTGLYYLQDGVRVTGMKKIEGAYYYFNESGYRVTGPVVINGVTYYFNPGNGQLITGVSGMRQIGDDPNLYYFFLARSNGAVATNRWVAHNGNYYYAGEDGKILFGTVKINGYLFHLTKEGRLTGYQKSSYDNKYYYANSYGVLRTGLQKIDGKLYYFSLRTGERLTGSLKVNGKYYYFLKSSGNAMSGWARINKWMFYYDTQGQRITGMKTINGKKYYFDPALNGARAENRWIKLDGKYYYFGANGVVKTGFFAVKTLTYYADSDGVRQTGWQTIKGRKYFLSTRYGILQTGWVTYKNNRYYLNPSKSSSTYGAAVTGWAKISGKNYYFNSDGTLKTGAWVYDSGSKAYYYLDSKTGAVLTGRQQIGGIWYDLGSSGAYKQDPNAPYVIKVNRVMNCITIYKGDIPYKAMVCSTAADGVSTPLGTFKLLDKLRWHTLNGPSWGQYCSHITSSILFHSVPCTRPNDNHSLNTYAFNQLGKPASGGCIRLTVADAKWIYDNCPIGTKVVIYDNKALSGPLGKPSAPRIPSSQTYDPTDPNA